MSEKTMENCGMRAGDIRDWRGLNAHDLEIIFSKLPEISVLRAACVCKQWHSVARAPTFIQFYTDHATTVRSCRFTVKGVKYCLNEHQSRGLSFEQSYHVPKVACTKEGEVACLEGAGGVFYALTGSDRTTVHYKLGLLQQDWQTTPQMGCRVHDPIVGVLRDTESGAHKLVIAGGVVEVAGEDDDLIVEIYDSATNCWEICDPLPYEFRGCTSSLFMRSVVHRGRFYAYDTYSGFVSELDVETKHWSAVKVLRQAVDVKRSFLTSQTKGLCLVGIQDANDRDLRFDVWNVNEATTQLGEVLGSTIIVNARPAPPSTRWTSRYAEFFANCVGLLLWLIAHFLVLCYTWSRRACGTLRHVTVSASVSVICVRLNYLRALRRSVSKADRSPARRLNPVPSFLCQ